MESRLKFSTENAYTVRYLMSSLKHQSRTSLSFSFPRAWPSFTSSVPRISLAYLRLPSMITAMCWGISYSRTSFSMRFV